jgi:hypothetical protein
LELEEGPARVYKSTQIADLSVAAKFKMSPATGRQCKIEFLA